MSNKTEIEKAELIQGKLTESFNVSQNNVQIEQPLSQSVKTRLEISSETNDNKIAGLEKNTDISQDLLEKYRLIALHTSDFIAFTTFDVNPIFTYVSPSHKKILGYEPEDLLGKSGLDFIHEDDKQHILTQLLSYYETKINGNLSSEMIENAPKLDFRFRDKSGQWHYMHSTVNLVNEEILLISKDVTEQKYTELKLKDNEQKMHAIIQGLSISAFVLGRDHKVIYWNKALEELSHIRAEEIIGTTNQWRAFYKEKRPCMADILIDGGIDEIIKWYAGKYKKSSLLGESFEAIDFFHHLGTDGKWLQFTATIIRNENGDLVGVLETLEDITERKKAEDALKKSEEKFVKTFKSSPVAICITRISDGKFIEVNESLIQLSCYTRSELLSGSSIGLNLWADSEDRKQVVELLAKTGTVHDYEYRFRIKGGNEIFVRYSAELIDINDERCVLSALVDITERKKIEESLRESEEKYRSLVENTQDVIMVTNPDGRVSYMSPACFNVLGYNPDDLVGTILEIFHPEDIEKVRTTFSNALQGNSGSNFEYRILTKNRDTRWVSQSWAPIFTIDHKLKFIVSVVRNITESKRAEQNLRAKIEELEKYKNVTVNREVKMIELKKEINELNKQLHQNPKYSEL